MKENNSALRVAQDYFQAWTGGDIDRAMGMLDKSFTSRTPRGVIKGAEAYQALVAPYARILKDAKLVAAFAEGDTVLMYYDTSTGPVANASGAEWLRIADGKIVEGRIVFDRLPFAEAGYGEAGKVLSGASR